MIDRDLKEVAFRGGNGPGEVGQLKMQFVVPGSGSGGTDKVVSFGEATAVRVTFIRDGYVVQKLLTPAQAEAVLHQAEHDAIAMYEREAGSPEESDPPCLVCGSREFARHPATATSTGPATETRVCSGCGYVMQFSLGPRP